MYMSVLGCKCGALCITCIRASYFTSYIAEITGKQRLPVKFLVYSVLKKVKENQFKYKIKHQPSTVF